MTKHMYNSERLVGYISEYAIERIEPRCDAVVISIRHPGDSVANIPNGYEDVLYLAFDDVEEDIGNYQRITFEQAFNIVEYVRSNLDKHIIVNCFAGMSRSAAVSQWISDNFNYSLVHLPESVHTTKYMNRYVYSMLDSVIGKDMRGYYEELDRITRDGIPTP